MKKRPVLLLEVLIALSLTAILLTLLFNFFVESMKVEKKLDAARVEVASRALLQTRLHDVLSNCSSLRTEKMEKEACPSWILVYDNGIDPDPAFSGMLLGRLFIEEGKLCLASWPMEKKNSAWRKEILMRAHGYESLFLEDALAWKSEWTKGAPPSMVRLLVKKDAEEVRFAFLLPRSKPMATYKEKSA